MGVSSSPSHHPPVIFILDMFAMPFKAHGHRDDTFLASQAKSSYLKPSASTSTIMQVPSGPYKSKALSGSYVVGAAQAVGWWLLGYK